MLRVPDTSESQAFASTPSPAGFWQTTAAATESALSALVHVLRAHGTPVPIAEECALVAELAIEILAAHAPAGTETPVAITLHRKRERWVMRVAAPGEVFALPVYSSARQQPVVRLPRDQVDVFVLQQLADAVRQTREDDQNVLILERRVPPPSPSGRG